MQVRLGALQRGHRNRIREILDATSVFRDEEVAVALELFDETFAAGPARAPYDPGDGVEAAAHIGADSRVAQDERLGLDARAAGFPPLFLRSRQRGQRLVQSISRRALRNVEHDHVDAKLLASPQRSREQHIARPRQIAAVFGAKQHDRSIARNADRPQRGWAAAAAAHLRATALRGVADEQSAEPAREPMAFFFVDAEAGSLGLGGTPGIGEEALRGAGVVKIRRKAQRVGAGMRSAHPEQQPHAHARRKHETPAQAEDGIEHAAHTPREMRARLHRLRVSQGSTAADEPRAVRLVFRRGFCRLSMQLQGRGQPYFLFFRRTTPACGEQDAAARIPFGLDEHLRKGGMRVVGAARPEHELGIRGQGKLARGFAVVFEKAGVIAAGSAIVIAHPHEDFTANLRAIFQVAIKAFGFFALSLSGGPELVEFLDPAGVSSACRMSRGERDPR